eukprot:s2313_g7.t3
MAMLRVTRMSGEELTRVPLTELSDVKSLKQRLKEQHGLPPWFRQRLLHDGNPLDDSVKLDSAMDLQVVVVGFNQATENQRKDLFDAADKGNLTKVERLLQLPMDPDARLHEKLSAQVSITGRGVTKPNVYRNWPLLYEASARGQADVVQLLLEAGADKDFCDTRGMGRTPVLAAAYKGHAQVVRLLLEAGSRKDVRDINGRTALIAASMNGHTAVVQLLLEAGAEKDARDSEDRTALMEASRNGHISVVQLLVDAGAERPKWPPEEARRPGDLSPQARRERPDTKATCFRMVLNGEIEAAEMGSGGNGPFMCVFSVQHGPDWTLVTGVPDGITQLACSSIAATSAPSWRGGLSEVVWSFPLGLVYKSTSPFGWPRLVVTVYGTDLCNRRVVKGYGSVHVPCQPGRHTRTIRLYCPLSSSPLTRLLGALFGNPAQLVDPRILAGTDGREVIRVQSGGKVRVNFDVLLKDTEPFNYAF